MEFTILNTQKRSAKENMAIDEELLQDIDSHEDPILHLYQWERDSATYGHFTQIDQLLNLDEVKKKKMDLAKRITGGGVTFHFCDYAFSFLMPKKHPLFSTNTLQNYRFVNQRVYEAVSSLIEEKDALAYLEDCQCDYKNKELNFCMAKPTKYDVIYKGKKIGGAAQRRTSMGYLHQGTVSIAMPDLEYLKSILTSKVSFDAIYENTFFFVSNHLDHENVSKYRQKVEENLIQAFRAC